MPNVPFGGQSDYLSGASAISIPSLGNLLKESFKMEIGRPLRDAVKKHVVTPFDTLNKTFDKFSKRTAKGKERMAELFGPIIDFVKTIGNTVMKTATGLMSPFTKVFGFLDMLGVLDPILKTLNGLLALFSGTLLKALMPAFEKLMALLTSPQMINIITRVAEILGAILGPIIEIFVELLDDMMPYFEDLVDIFDAMKPLLIMVAKIIGGVFLEAIKGIVNFLALMFGMGEDFTAAEIGGAIGAAIGGIVGAALATYIGQPMLGGVIGAFIGSMIGTGIGGLFMAEGGITRGRTSAVLGDNPSGIEMVVPLERAGEMGFGGQPSITVNFDGGVYATNMRQLSREIARTIKLYNY
ncbi:MAG: hypothetical protein ACTSSH_01035 [Candidatus Heimdallarchaeota archaeon]